MHGFVDPGKLRPCRLARRRLAQRPSQHFRDEPADRDVSGLPESFEIRQYRGINVECGSHTR